MDPYEIEYSRESMLIVDDDFYLRETLQELIATLGFGKIDCDSNGLDALKKLENDNFSFVLTDMKMPEMGGMELIQRVKEDYPDISMIAMTGYSEGYKYVDVINAGANDFIKKPFELGELEAKIRRIIAERNLKEELSRLSITDSLTGLFNQRHFYTRIKEEVQRASRQNHSLSLVLLDMDNFKEYNDTHGHLAGDEVLKKAGNLINQGIRQGVDSGYRYGGDEFAVILIEADLDITQDIEKRLKDSFINDSEVNASIGHAIYEEGMSEKDLMLLADKRLYKGKEEKDAKL